METQKINTKKQILRKQIREKNAHLDPEYCLWADKRIREWILNWKYFQKAETIFCFVGTAGEIHTKPLIQAALDQGKRVAVPKCISKGIMEARQIRSLGELYPGSYGIEEPEKAAEIIEPEEISLALVPCLTCSETAGVWDMEAVFTIGFCDPFPALGPCFAEGV